MTRQDPDLLEIARTLPCLGEIEGFTEQLTKDRRMTPAIQNALAVRKVEIMKGQKCKS